MTDTKPETAAEVKERRPLYEPKHRNVLEKREKVAVKRWPDIDIPPLKTKPWQPPVPPTKKQPPLVVLPPLTLRKKPWKPPLKDLPFVEQRKLIGKPPPKSAKSETTMEPPKPPKDLRHFKRIGPKFHVLLGTISQSSKRFSHLTNDRQSAAISAVAAVYSHMLPTDTWKAYHVDDIVCAGDAFYKQSKRLKKGGALTPPKVHPLFYWQDSEVTFSIGGKTASGEYNAECKESLEHLQGDVKAILDDYVAAIVSFCNKSFACWSCTHGFCLFNSHGSMPDGTPTLRYKGVACVLSIKTLATLVEYLALYMKPTCGHYAVYSFEIQQVCKISKLPKMGVDIAVEVPAVQKLQNLIAGEEMPTLPPIIEETVVAEAPEIPEKEPEEPFYSRKIQEKPLVIDFNEAYEAIKADRGILRGVEFVAESARTPCINVAAIAMLRQMRASTWSPVVLTEILRQGNEIYEANLEHVEGEEILVSDIKTPIKFNDRLYRLDTEHLIFGRLMSKDKTLANLQRGLSEFFKTCDTGVLQGPQSVAVWQERGVYFMFDPKERDREGRKWMEKLPTDGGDTTTMAGTACVTWYQAIDDLADVYQANINLRHRHDLYRVTKVEVTDHLDRSPDFYAWKGIAVNKWIIRGSISQKNLRFSTMSRNRQGTNTAVVALALLALHPTKDWDAAKLDAVLVKGDEHYMKSVLKLKSTGRYKRPLLHIGEIDTSVSIDDTLVELTINQCVQWGSLVAQPNDEYANLRHALKEFFRNYETGVIICCGLAVAVWKEGNFYYLYDSHRRDGMGRNPLVGDPEGQQQHKGTACAMRFGKFCDFAVHVSNLFVVVSSPEFNIHNVIPAVTVLSKEQINYHSYSPITDGAMLRPLYDSHEDIVDYETKCVHKTVCNCLMALAMSQVIPSQMWKRSDVNEILKLGWKMYLSVEKESGEPDVATKPDWELYPDNLQIGVNWFPFERTMVTCRFQPLALAAGDEMLEKASVIGSTKSDADLSRPVSAESMVLPSPSIRGDSVVLAEILNGWDEEQQKLMILESELFIIALWKQHNLYFMFDPKTCDKVGHLDSARLELIVQAIQKRDQKNHVELVTQDSEPQLTDFEEDYNLSGDMVKKMPKAMPAKTMHNLLQTGANDADKKADNYVPCAAVVWFHTPRQLCQHVLDHVTEKYVNEECTVHEIAFDIVLVNTCAEEEATRWHQFEWCQKGQWAVRGSLAQGDVVFAEANRNQQDVPNCVVALSMAQLCAVDTWNSTLVDIVLKYGDRLYSKSLHQARNDDPELLTLNNRRINPYQTASHFTVVNCRITTEISLFAFGDITLEQTSPLVKSLYDAIDEFFEEPTAQGLLEAKNYYIAVWKDGDSFLVFDPHEIGPDGRRKVNGMACVSRFVNTEELVRNFFGNLDYTDGTNYFNVYKVNITKSAEFSNECTISETCLAADCDTANQRLEVPAAFTAFQEWHALRLLFGTVADSDVGALGMLPPRACYAIAALVMNKMNNVEFWTPKDMDEVLHLGMHLYAETMAQTTIHDPIERLLPQHVVWNFKLANHLFINVGMQLFATGHITAATAAANGVDNLSLLTAFEEFFLTFSHAIVTLPENQTLAVWKQCGRYFVYYSTPCNHTGDLVEGTAMGVGEASATSCLISTPVLGELSGKIHNNLPKRCWQDVYELRKCTITMTAVSTEPYNQDQ